MRQLKHSFLLIILLLATAFSGWIFFQDDQSATAPAGPEVKTSPTLKKTTPRQEITGVSYSTTMDDNALFTLQADSITLRKKRIGFLRFNLFTEVLIRNGVFQIYEPAPLPNNTPETDSPGMQGRKKNRQKLISREIRNSLLPPLPAKRIISMASRPATLIIHHNDSTETRISSSEAIIGREKNTIIFNGNAKAVSGNKTLSAGRLHVSLKRRTITAGGSAVLTTPRGRHSFRHTKTDLLLNIEN